MPSLFILMPLFAVILLNLIPRSMRRLAFWFAVLLFLAEIVLALKRYPHILKHEFVAMSVFFNVHFSIDHLSSIMFLCIGIVSLASLAVARMSITDDETRFKFINLLVLSSIGMCGIVLTNDIFSLYVFLEITSVTSFIMIAFQKGLDSLEGAFKYLVLSVIATALMLASIALIILVSKDISFTAIAEGLKTAREAHLVLFAIGLFACGLFIKGGVVPFHGWLADAYSSAPAPVSVLLAGVVTKVCGIYTIIRLFTGVFGFTDAFKNILMLAGTISILVGAFAAIGQNNFKRMLAYSSISQVGYIIVGLGTGTPLGIAAAAFHLFNHAIFKTLLFVNSAAVEKETGTLDIDRMGGISAKMPTTGATSVVAILSASGIPPLAGFWSKLLIIIALWQAGSYTYAVIAVLASIVTLGYLLILQRKVFFGKLKLDLEEIREPGAGIVTISVILALIIVTTGVMFPIVYTKLIMPIGMLTLIK